MASDSCVEALRIDSFAVTSLHLTKYIMRRFLNRPSESHGRGDRANAHDPAAVERDAPPAGPGDFGNQAVSVEAAKGAADLGAFLFGVVSTGSQVNRRCKPCPDVVVGEASQAMLAGHEGLE